LQNQGEAFGRHVPSLHHPIFALLDENHRDEAERRLAVGEDADRARATADFAVEMFDRVSVTA